MHINVSDILADVVGRTETFTVSNEPLDDPEITLTEPVNGRFTITKDDTGLGLSGHASLAIELECHRCLQKYTQALQFDLRAHFSTQPEADDWLITAEEEIDLAPVIRDEALVHVPIQQICRPDCTGLCDTCGQPRVGDHEHLDQIVVHRPNIITKKD
jgi:uncharacterized protein